jgi:hypothetical protein
MAVLRLVSNGNAGCREGQEAAEKLKAAGAAEDVIEEFENGERFKKTPELAMESFRAKPRIEPYSGYLVAKPLELLERAPEVVVALVDALGLSALVVLANYARPSNDNVIIPFAAGCSTIWGQPFAECSNPQPRAVIGLTDPSARKPLKRLLGRDLLSFAMPFKLFEEMEANVQGSFLERPVWRGLAG